MNPFKSGAKLGKHGQTGGKFGTKTVFPYLYRIFRRFPLCTLSIEYQQHLTLRGICNPTQWSIRICNPKKQFLFAGHTHTTVIESPCGLADSEIRSSCCTGLQIRRSVCLRNDPSVRHADVKVHGKPLRPFEPPPHVAWDLQSHAMEYQDL